MEHLHIRRAGPDEAEPISALIISLAHHFTVAPDGSGADAFFERMNAAATAERLASPEFTYITAWQAGQLAGVVTVRGPSHIFHLFVPDALHRQGIGSRLWQAAREHIGAVEKITVNSSPFAHRFYQSLGFRDTAARTEMDGIAFYPMELLLTPASPVR